MQEGVTNLGVAGVALFDPSSGVGPWARRKGSCEKVVWLLRNQGLPGGAGGPPEERIDFEVVYCRGFDASSRFGGGGWSDFWRIGRLVVFVFYGSSVCVVSGCLCVSPSWSLLW